MSRVYNNLLTILPFCQTIKTRGYSDLINFAPNLSLKISNMRYALSVAAFGIGASALSVPRSWAFFQNWVTVYNGRDVP